MPGFSSVGTFKIFIGNLADKTSNADIKPLFEKYGKVVECDVVKNYGFVVSVTSTESNTINECDQTYDIIIKIDNHGAIYFSSRSIWRMRKQDAMRYKI